MRYIYSYKFRGEFLQIENAIATFRIIFVKFDKVCLVYSKIILLDIYNIPIIEKEVGEDFFILFLFLK